MLNNTACLHILLVHVENDMTLLLWLLLSPRSSYRNLSCLRFFAAFTMIFSYRDALQFLN
jgi:hypothetical protein